jgi:hypothetical protein
MLVFSQPMCLSRDIHKTTLNRAADRAHAHDLFKLWFSRCHRWAGAWSAARNAANRPVHFWSIASREEIHNVVLSGDAGGEGEDWLHAG